MDYIDIASETEYGLTYRVYYDQYENFFCSCGDYVFRHKRCKHCQAAKDTLDHRKLAAYYAGCLEANVWERALGT